MTEWLICNGCIFNRLLWKAIQSWTWAEDHGEGRGRGQSWQKAAPACASSALTEQVLHEMWRMTMAACKPWSRCSSSSFAVERGPWLSEPQPAPGSPSCTCVWRGANDNGCGPITQPIWNGTLWPGSGQELAARTGAAGILGSQGALGCPWGPDAHGWGGLWLSQRSSMLDSNSLLASPDRSYQGEPWYTFMENANVQILWRIVWQFLKNLSIHLTYDPAITFLTIYPREMRTSIHMKIWTWVSIAAWFITATRWKPPKCPLMGGRLDKPLYICIMEDYSAMQTEELSYTR